MVIETGLWTGSRFWESELGQGYTLGPGRWRLGLDRNGVEASARRAVVLEWGVAGGYPKKVP